MPDDRTERFVDALHALEEDRDLDRIASLFTDDAELISPTHASPHRGPDAARAFWDAYRRTFAEIRSEFRNIVESDGTAMLEWQSRGRTSTGGALDYAGVSVLEFDGDRIRSFRSYFDSHELGEDMQGRSARE